MSFMKKFLNRFSVLSINTGNLPSHLGNIYSMKIVLNSCSQLVHIFKDKTFKNQKGLG
jgi:hypothetical protein